MDSSKEPFCFAADKSNQPIAEHLHALVRAYHCVDGVSFHQQIDQRQEYRQSR